MLPCCFAQHVVEPTATVLALPLTPVQHTSVQRSCSCWAHAQLRPRCLQPRRISILASTPTTTCGRPRAAPRPSTSAQAPTASLWRWRSGTQSNEHIRSHPKTDQPGVRPVQPAENEVRRAAPLCPLHRYVSLLAQACGVGATTKTTQSSDWAASTSVSARREARPHEKTSHNKPRRRQRPRAAGRMPRGHLL